MDLDSTPIDHAEGGGTGAAAASWLAGTSASWLGAGRSGPTRTLGSWRERGRAAAARVGRSGLELDGKRQNRKNSGWGSHLGGRGEQWQRGLCSGEEDLGRCVPSADGGDGVVVRFLTRWRRRLRRRVRGREWGVWAEGSRAGCAACGRSGGIVREWGVRPERRGVGTEVWKVKRIFYLHFILLGVEKRYMMLCIFRYINYIYMHNSIY
jgi:hypothetical protein